MSQLKENLNAILEEKAKIKANDIVQGTTLFGIQGTLPEVKTNAGYSLGEDDLSVSGNEIRLTNKSFGPVLIRSGWWISFSTRAEYLAKKLNLSPDKIKKGETILGVEGELEEGIDTSDANAVAQNILQGKTAYVNGEKIEGSMANLSTTSIGFRTNSAEISENDIGLRVSVTPSNSGYIEMDSTKIGNTIPKEKVVESLKITSDKLVEGVTMFGVQGSVKPYVDPESTADYQECLTLTNMILGLQTLPEV